MKVISLAKNSAKHSGDSATGLILVNCSILLWFSRPIDYEPQMEWGLVVKMKTRIVNHTGYIYVQTLSVLKFKQLVDKDLVLFNIFETSEFTCLHSVIFFCTRSPHQQLPSFILNASLANECELLISRLCCAALKKQRICIHFKICSTLTFFIFCSNT